MPREKRARKSHVGQAGLDFQGDPGIDRWPELIAHLADGSWSDGSSRTPGRISIFVQDGTWKACLTEPDLGEVAFVSSSTFNGLYDALEAALQTGQLDWRPDRKAKQGQHRRS